MRKFLDNYWVRMSALYLICAAIIILLCVGCSKNETKPIPTPVRKVMNPIKPNVQAKLESQGYYQNFGGKMQDAADLVTHWCDRAGIDTYEQWAIALLYEESKMCMEMKGTTGETDCGQLAPMWKSFYYSYRSELFQGEVFAKGTLTDEISVFVAAFHYNIKLAKGDPKEAVRRYHSGSTRGHKFVRAVTATKRKMYRGY